MGALIITILAAGLCIFEVIPLEVFLRIELASIVWAIIGAVLYFKAGLLKFFYHDFLGWHTPDKSPQQWDGLTWHATCKHCGKDIMLDSQGNWF